MGACIGKKSSKYLNRKLSQSNLELISSNKVKDENLTKKSSKEIIVINIEQDDKENSQQISTIDQISINSELQIIIDEQKQINKVFSQPLSSRIISCTDTELELELSMLMSEYSDKDFEKIPLTPTVNNEINM